MSTRYTQFAGFARALYNELPPDDQERHEEIIQIIAQRAYDLVKHTLIMQRTEHLLTIDASIAYIPDLTELPEVSE